MKGYFLTSIYLTDDYRFSLAYLGASCTLSRENRFSGT